MLPGVALGDQGQRVLRDPGVAEVHQRNAEVLAQGGGQRLLLHGSVFEQDLAQRTAQPLLLDQGRGQLLAAQQAALEQQLAEAFFLAQGTAGGLGFAGAHATSF